VNLGKLINREIMAIVLNDISTPEEDEKASEQIRFITATSNYRWKTDLTIVGVSIGEAHESKEAEARYLTESDATTRLLRESIFPHGSPVSRVVERVGKCWPAGVHVPEMRGHRFLPEVVRRWTRGGAAHPHVDQSRTPLLEPLAIRLRIGINHYLSMPTEGGAIEFWDRQFTDEEYMGLKRRDYGVDRSLLGDPDFKTRPLRGQTVIFRAWEPHAVEPVAGEGDRITNAAFLGFKDFDTPLAQFA
jgi:hypothetical protein